MKNLDILDRNPGRIIILKGYRIVHLMDNPKSGDSQRSTTNL